ncbi:MAG: methyltransferase domain-containing protein [Vicinamibacterales bacterium]
MDVLTPRHDSTSADAGSRRRPAAPPLAIGLFNDGGDEPQVVSLAVSQAHRRMLQRAGAHVRHAYFRGDWHELGEGSLDDGIAAALASPELRRVFADIDVVVVAGETLRDRPHRHLLAILAAAQHLDIPTYLVDASIGPMSEGLDVLMGLADCTVRDGASDRLLKRLGVAHRRVADTLLAAPFVGNAVRDFADHLVITDSHPTRRIEHTADLAAVRAAWPGMVADYPLDAPGSAWDWTHAVADLGTASAVLAGGRDGASLALKAGVPFVVFGANADAAEFIGALEGYPAGAADTTRPLDARVQAAIDAREWFVEAAQRCQARGPADIFTRLRPSMALSGRDDTWTGSIEGTVDVVRQLTPAGGSVLHAGAGQGQLVEALARTGLRSWGADVARRLDRPDRTRYSTATPVALPFADHVFSTVVVSADWLEHLEVDDLEAAVAELARVGKDAIVIETSGRPPRADRAFEDRVSPEWWRRRLADLGLGLHDAADTCITHGAGPTGGTLLVLSTQAHLCPNCRRAHVPAEIVEPVHAGVLMAAAQLRGAVTRR